MGVTGVSEYRSAASQEILRWQIAEPRQLFHSRFQRESGREGSLRGSNLGSRFRGNDKMSFRETLSPLKSLKTAKSLHFRTQRYQMLSKTHDFTGEMISLRFGFAWKGGARRAGAAKIWKMSSNRKKACFSS
jgi:hypothetical protein